MDGVAPESVPFGLSKVFLFPGCSCNGLPFRVLRLFILALHVRKAFPPPESSGRGLL